MTLNRRDALKAFLAGTALLGATAIGVNHYSPSTKYRLGEEVRTLRGQEFGHSQDPRIDGFVQALIEFHDAHDRSTTADNRRRSLTDITDHKYSKLKALDQIGFCDADIFSKIQIMEDIGFVYVPFINNSTKRNMGKIIDRPTIERFDDIGTDLSYKLITYDSTGYYPKMGTTEPMMANSWFHGRAYADLRALDAEERRFYSESERVINKEVSQLDTNDRLLLEAYHLFAQEAGIKPGAIPVEPNGRIDQKAHETFLDMTYRRLRHHEPVHNYTSEEKPAYRNQLVHADTQFDATYGLWQLQNYYADMFSEDMKLRFLETQDFQEKKNIFRK
ncbi:MAG: hypothetical protein KKE20_05105 [Nanoarchaeota archaeon]|nr:hypothetical protein [Nanoarchaeota archaeon]